MARYFFALIALIQMVYCGQKVLAQSQNPTTISFPDSTPFPDRVYQSLRSARIICLGEMHGTQEPPAFMWRLAELFRRKGRKVIAGFEVQEADMAYFRQHPEDSLGLFNSHFFQFGYGDGRNNSAWLKCMQLLHQNQTPLCFFDGPGQNRDSTMANRILYCLSHDTSAVMLTLSGNFHLAKREIHGKRKMAGYLSQHPGNKVITLNHFYEAGNMYNLTSAGLGLHQIPSRNDKFQIQNPSEIIFRYPFGPEADCDGGFFTQQVHAAYPVRYKFPDNSR